MATKKECTLCLNMIVKNESGVILRLLESVAPILDAYCICDTGSTDDTIQQIEIFFREKNIPGIIVKEPFQNFEYNRSFALNACNEMMDVDYLLLMDADMIFWMDENKLTPEKLKRMLPLFDSFFIFQGSQNMYYKNTRIVKNRTGVSYKGVTHEYVDLPENATQGTLDRNIIFIKDIGDGGAKSDKFERDVRLLKQGLVEDPTNARYMFYLANSLKDLASTTGYQKKLHLSQIQYNISEIQKSLKLLKMHYATEKTDSELGFLITNIEKIQTTAILETNEDRHECLKEAIEWYKKRIKAGGFWEEVWYSHYNIGHAFFHLKEFEKALYYFYKAYVLFPQRIENIYEIVKYYRKQGDHELAVYYYLLGKASLKKYPDREYLFTRKDIYDYKLDYEMTISGFYVNPTLIHLQTLCMTILMQKQEIDDDIGRSVLSNYKFYTEKIRDKDTKIWDNNGKGNVLEKLGRDMVAPEFNSSTPTFCVDDKSKETFCLVRYVDYKVNELGEYEQRSKIQTINVIAKLRQDGRTIDPIKILDYDRSHDSYYVGLEDVRLFRHPHDDNIYYCGNRGIDHGKMVVEHGSINRITLKTEKARFLKIQDQQPIEKNWVMFQYLEDPEPIYMVYNWYPMVIGKVVDDVLDIQKKIATPSLFKYIRGSTNGISVNNEVWFLCHVVSYEERRYYYHIMVMLDAKTLELRRTSPMFTFERQKIEYCLGMDIVDEQDIRFGYSIMDRETKYLSVPKSIFM